MSDRLYRQAIVSILRRSEPRFNLGWGFTLTATELYGDSGYGHLAVVTPYERVGLNRSMLEATRGRVMMLGGHTVIHVDLPDNLCEVPPLEVLPAVEINLILAAEIGSTSVHARLPWQLLRDFPIPVLTVTPLDGWPR